MTKVLIVEPDKTLGKAMKKYFDAEGDLVLWVKDSAEALTAIDSFSPDIVTLELQLPKHNGLELLYEIRSYPDWDKLRLVLFTNVQESLLAKSPTYKQLKIAKHLYKPSNTLGDLKAAVLSVASE